MANKYFQPSKYGWKFKAETKNRREEKQTITISRLMEIPIARHVKVKGTASPDDPSLTQYWEDRWKKIGKNFYPKGSRKYNIANQQNWKCQKCGESLFNGEPIEMHHITPVKDSGYEFEDNLEFIHKNCHKDSHGRRAWAGWRVNFQVRFLEGEVVVTFSPYSTILIWHTLFSQCWLRWERGFRLLALS